MNPTFKFIKVPVEISAKSFVILKLPDGERFTPADVQEALAATVDIGHLDLAGVSAGKAKPATTREAREFQTHRPRRTLPSMEQRAKETGLTRMTLWRWQQEGIDVMNDWAVRAKLATIRRRLKGINPRFRPGYVDPDDYCGEDLPPVSEDMSFEDSRNESEG